MLIKCPECGKEISDKAKKCIHCGYPLGELGQGNNIIKQYILSDTVCPICKSDEHILVDGCMDGCKMCGYVFSIVDEEVYQANNMKKIQAIRAIKNIPHCPRCGSTNIQRQQVCIKGSIMVDALKPFLCSMCGYEWK